MSITYRMLPLNEWDKLEPLYTKLFPERDFSVYSQEMVAAGMVSAAVAEYEGEIVGFWFLQLVAHAEPVGVDPEFRHVKIDLDKLRATIHEAYPAGLEYYICAPTPEWGEVFERRGFWPVGMMYGARIPERGGN